MDEMRRKIEREKNKQIMIMALIAIVLIVAFIAGQDLRHSRMRNSGACEELWVDLQNKFGELNNNEKYQQRAMTAHDTAELTQLKKDSIDIVEELVDVLNEARVVGCKNEWFKGGKS